MFFVLFLFFFFRISIRTCYIHELESIFKYENKLTKCRGEHEVRCMKRKLLLETLEKELPSGTIKYSSKLVSIEDLGNFKLLHLADGTSIKAKVILGIKSHPLFPFQYVVL